MAPDSSVALLAIIFVFVAVREATSMEQHGRHRLISP